MMNCEKQTVYLNFLYLLIFIASINSKGYGIPEHLSREVWDEVKPYLLPENHPAKPILDGIFVESRVTSNTQTIRSAGFKYITKQGEHVKTVRHSKLNGYLVKMLVDTDTFYLPEWKHWIQRIKGADQIREGILKHQYEEMMVVPKKWIYMLPKHPLPRKEVEAIAKHFVMIVEDLNILDDRENKSTYKKKIKKKHLRALFNIVTEFGLRDSCSIDKIPWTKEGQIAFINTECLNCWPINYLALTKYLAPTKRVYWQQLIRKQN